MCTVFVGVPPFGKVCPNTVSAGLVPRKKSFSEAVARKGKVCRNTIPVGVAPREQVCRHTPFG